MKKVHHLSVVYFFCFRGKVGIRGWLLGFGVENGLRIEKGMGVKLVSEGKAGFRGVC